MPTGARRRRNAPRLPVPAQTLAIPAAALETHIAILGKTGSGKSNLAKTITETLLAQGKRVCVIDPTGTWWGLRLDSDGVTPSPHRIVIFGGAQGDLPAEAAHGAVIAEAIATSATPAIIDTREMTVAARTTLFTAFAETVLRTNRGELTLVIDEAHLFMPQSGTRGAGASPAMLHAGNNLVSLGRGAGLRIVLISQRPAKLHKDSLTQVETLVAMRLIAPQDRKAIDDWIGEWAAAGEGREVARSLPSLSTGEAWIWSPGIGHLKRTQCPLAATYDSAGARTFERPTLQRVDIGAVARLLEQTKAHRATIGSTPHRPPGRDADGNTQAERARRLDAERALREAQAAHAATLQRMRSDLDAVARDLRAGAARIDTIGEALAEQARPERDTPPREPPARAPATPEARANHPHRELTGPQQRILDGLHWLESTGIATSADRAQAAFVAGYKPGGGAYNNTLGALRTAGLVSYPTPGEVALTETGRARAHPTEQPASTESLQASVFARLSRPQQRVLAPLLKAWPESLSVRETAQAAGYEAAGGAFNNIRGRLRTLQLIEYPAPGRARARSILFLDDTNATPR